MPLLITLCNSTIFPTLPFASLLCWLFRTHIIGYLYSAVLPDPKPTLIKKFCFYVLYAWYIPLLYHPPHYIVILCLLVLLTYWIMNSQRIVTMSKVSLNPSSRRKILLLGFIFCCLVFFITSSAQPG